MKDMQTLLEHEVKAMKSRLGDTIAVRVPPYDFTDNKSYSQYWIVESIKPPRFKHIYNTVSYFVDGELVLEKHAVGDELRAA